MNETPRSTTSLGTRAMAVIVLLIAAWVLLHFLIGIAIAVASVVVIIAAIVAVIWAVRILS